MEVGSPENGFDEISDLLKDDESTLPEDLDLSFIMRKDISVDYVCDDSTCNDEFNFHLSEQGQSELPSLSSTLGCYEIPGPHTEKHLLSAEKGCHYDGLLDANVIDDKKLHFEPWRDQYHQDAHKLSDGYLGDSTFEMNAESVGHEVLNDVCHQPDGFASMQDHGLEGEIMDRPNTIPNAAIGEKTFLEALEQELNQDEFAYSEEKEEYGVSVDQIQKLHSPSLHWDDPKSKSENDNNLRNSPDVNKEVDSAHFDQHDKGRTSESVSPFTSREILVFSKTSHCAHHLTDDHRFSGRNDISYPITTHDQIYGQSACRDQNGDTPSMDHALHAGRDNFASSLGSGQKSHFTEGSFRQSVATTGNRHRKRSRSLSPRPRNRSSKFRRGCSTNSQAKSPNSWEVRKRSSEKVTCFHLSPTIHEISVSQDHKEFSSSSGSRKHKHDWAGSSFWGREITCKDHLLDSGCQKSLCQHEPQERLQKSSSLKHASALPINHHSLHNQRKIGRSVSPSPVQRRDHCSGYKREHNKSRSRSPYRRNRKKCSQRHLSPPRSYFSRYRSHNVGCLSPASCRRTGIGKPGTCLFVAGFGFLTTERELERKFSRFGHVRNVRIIRDKRSGISRGYGFLSLERDEEADAAIRALHKTEWNGRVVLVEKSISN